MRYVDIIWTFVYAEILNKKKSLEAIEMCFIMNCWLHEYSHVVIMQRDKAFFTSLLMDV